MAGRGVLATIPLFPCLGTEPIASCGELSKRGGGRAVKLSDTRVGPIEGVFLRMRGGAGETAGS